jgi:hypothetical protein
MCSELAAHTLLPVLGPVIDDPQWVDPDTLLRIQKENPALFTVEEVAQ